MIDEQKNKINVFLDSINIGSYKSEYIQERLTHGESYQFEFLNKKRLIYVYGFHYQYKTEELKYINKFATFLCELDESHRVIRNDKALYPIEKLYWRLDVDFGNLERFFEPELIPFE